MLHSEHHNVNAGLSMQHFNSLKEAARHAGVSYITIRVWCKEYGIGDISDGQWRIDREKLDRVIAAKDHIREIKSSLTGL